MANESKIIGGWSLLAFRSNYAGVHIGEFVNKKTGERFPSLVFDSKEVDEEGKPKERTFVHFSSKMGPLTNKQIKEQKDSLRVVKLESGNYSLCKEGENAWEDVDI